MTKKVPTKNAYSTFGTSEGCTNHSIDIEVSVPDEYTSLLKSNNAYALPPERNIENSTNDTETLIHLLKGNIGTGSLAMPKASMNLGLWAGLAATPMLGILATHCMHILLNSSREISRRTGVSSAGYEATAEASFRYGPEAVRSWDKTVGFIITVFLIVTQLGFCCVYFVFISQNLYQAVECILGGTSFSQFHYMVMVLFPILIICYLPDLKYLAPVSLVAAILQIIGFVITFYYCIRDLSRSGYDIPAFAGWSGVPLYFGTALYAFEGIGLILPLENNMKTPNSFPGLTGVLTTAMTIIISLYTAIGFFGYLSYGDLILGSITLNLPGNERLAQSVKLFMAIAIFCSYPLQMYVPFSLMKPSVVRRFSSTKMKIVAEYSLRSGLVLLTFVLAVTIPNVGLFINLIGSVSSTALALIFPPLIDSVTFWPHTGKFHWKICKNVLIILFGLVGFATGSYCSIKDIFEFFSQSDQSITLGC